MTSSTQKEIRKRNGSRHDKTGCLTCRYRRKKCTDNKIPVCGTCSRLSLKCVRAETKDIVPNSYADNKSQSTHATPPTQRMFPTGLSISGVAKECIDSSQKRQAMGYYISTLTNYLAVSQEYNSFLTAFLPMAMESVAMFDILLAFALGHLSLTNESYKITALETRSTAIRSLALAISTPTDQVAYYETNAAASLGFIIYDAAVGDCRAWYTHLKGTYNIIQSASTYLGGKLRSGPEALKHSAEGRWIIRNYAYHDIIGSITSRKAPLLRGNYLDGITDVVDSCIGVAAGLLSIIARIAFIGQDTATKRQPFHDEVREGQSIQSQYLDIERELLDWHCQANVSHGLTALAYAYRSAALIVLYRLVRSRIKANHAEFPDLWELKEDTMVAIQAKVQKQVTETLGHVTDIPVGSSPEGALLFPVFMAGGEAIEHDDIDSVRSRLRLMARKRQFRNLSRAQEVLEDLWDLREAEPGVDADWTQILDASGKGLLLT